MSRRVTVESEEWFTWLESARIFTFEGAQGRFTARKQRRWATDYWYAFRRLSGRLYETYLGRSRDITLNRLRAVATKLPQLAGRKPAPSGQSAVRGSPQLASAGETHLGMPRRANHSMDAPWMNPAHLIRTSAVDRLARLTDYPLTQVVAPSGFGKTTLVMQTVATLPLPTVWLALDERDNDPIYFWTRFSAAINDAAPGLLPLMGSPPGASGYLTVDAVLAAILDSLPRAGSSLVFVLDDYDTLRAENSILHESIAYFVGHMPRWAHLVILDKTIPPLPLAQLRAHRRLLELGAADLQLTLAEVRAFFTQRMKLNLSAEEIATLHTRTEGWVAALQLMALALRERSDAPRRLVGSEGEKRDIFGSLMESVLERLSPQMQRFALEVSLLDRVNASLCDTVTRTRNSQAMLEEMERANLFLMPLDARHEWYRVHPFFSDMLRRRLQRAQPALEERVYARASVWCEANDLPLDAIEYAFAAGDFARATRFVEIYVSYALTHGYVALLRDLLERLPDKFTRERPRLHVAHAFALYLTGDREIWPQCVREAEEALARAPDSHNPSEFAALRAEILALRACLHTTLSEDSPHALIGAFRQALAALPPMHEFRSFIALCIGLNQAIDGDLPSAHQTLENLTSGSETEGNAISTTYISWYLGLVRLLQGRLDDALAVYDPGARRRADSSKNELNDTLEAGPYLIRGKIFYERNELRQALKQLQYLVSLRYEPEISLIERLPALAYTYLGLGNAADAHRVIERSLAELAELRAEGKIFWIWTGRMIRAHQARLWLLDGKIQAASTWAREIELLNNLKVTENTPPSYVHEWEEIVLARTYLAEGHLRDALALLERLSAAAEADGRVIRLLEVLTLRAAVHDALGDTPAALWVLERAVELGARERFVRVFVDGGDAIHRLLLRVRTEHTGSIGIVGLQKQARRQRYLGILLSAFPPLAAAHTRKRSHQLEPAHASERLTLPITPTLTPRERDVIRLIAAGASNDDIARLLVITPATVKRHVSNIFEALGVRRRTQAVARARALGFLTPDEIDSVDLDPDE
jgi:LuxR family maltose regulon positive regulatory protein